ncbi:hypothetical protein EDD21DRAFT_156683 [Dissophora ornata]|nr:hypothetical protein EDD21DRAFT_156683 [Dissophora ornata]
MMDMQGLTSITWGGYFSLHFTLIANHLLNQRSAKEEEVYRRIQQAKAGGGRRSGESSSGYRANGSGEGFRPPPPPKQNGKGKNSKHFFWPHPEYNNNNNNNNNRNNSSNSGYDNTQNRRGQASSSNLQGGKPRNGPVQVLFNRATSLSDPAMQGENVEEDDDCEDDSENDSSDDLMINRGIDSDDDETDEEFLMQQFNWIEEEQDRVAEKIPQPAGKHQPQQLQKQHPSVDPISAPLQSLSALTLDNAMTQSEDFLQAMEAEGEINVQADEMENLSRSLAVLSPTSALSSANMTNEPQLVQVMSSTLQLSQDGTVLESQTEVVTQIVSTISDNNSQDLASPKIQANPPVAFAVEKPKKKAHRSKRGGVKQREKQMNKQMVVGHDDDGLIFLEEQSDDDEDDDDMLAMEDYLQVQHYHLSE